MLAGFAIVMAILEIPILNDVGIVEASEIPECSNLLGDLETDQDSQAIGNFAPMPNLITRAEKMCEEREAVFKTKLVARVPDHSLRSVPITVFRSPNFHDTEANK